MPCSRAKTVASSPTPRSDHTINRNNFRAMATSDRGRGIEVLVERLYQVFSLGEAEKNRLLRELRRSRNAQPIVVRENLGWEEVARVEFNAPDLPGVFIDLGQTRDYPEGELMSHIIGYAGRVADEDLAGRDDPVLQLATLRFGKKGVERSLEEGDVEAVRRFLVPLAPATVARFPVVPELRPNHDVVAVGAGERLLEQTLASAVAVRVGRIEERDASVEGLAQQRDGLLVAVLAPPAGGDGPDAKTDLGDADAGIRDRPVAHESRPLYSEPDPAPTAGVRNRRDARIL